MLRMIIADDESIVRNGLKKIVKWEELGIEVIGEAADGQEALELCMELKPDILFTDIRMPMMDGLEVAARLAEMKSSIRVVILSGAQDFNYAKTAMDVSAEGYVLKPVNLMDLSEIMKKVVNRIRLEKERQMEMINLKQQLHEHFPVIRDSFIKNLVSGAYKNELKIQDKLQYFKIPLKTSESILTAVLQIDDYTEATRELSEEDKQLLSFSISNIIEEIIQNNSAGISSCMNENEFVLIFNENGHLNRKYIEICEEISDCIGKFLHYSVSTGIGSRVNSIASIHYSYLDAHTALRYRFYTGKGSILDIADINIINNTDMKSIDSSGIHEFESQLMNCVRLGDGKAASELISEIFNRLCAQRNMPIDYIQSLCVELILIASRTVKDLGMNIESMTDKQPVILDTIYKKENAYDLKAYTTSIFLKMAECFSEKYNQKNTRIVNKIKEIIEQRYNENISVAKISEEIYLTPNYISMIFRQESGETITEYLVNVRMEHAKRLLTTTDLKILEIAEKVGYEDPHYFSKAFKKHTGVHPKTYRT